jgi:hypothetical protein
METKILEQVQERVEADAENQNLFKAYDDMDKMVWTPPENLLKDWVRVRINTSAHDALKQMSNIFDSHNPKWEILPLGEADVDRAEELESWLEYFAAKANLNGESSPFRQGLYNSGKFNRVIYEVDYLPYWLPKDKESWTPEQKSNAVNGPFCFTTHDPRCIYYEIGKYGLKWIANVNNLTGQQIIDHWSIYESDTEDGKQIKSGLAKLRAIIDKDEENENGFIYVDYTSHEDRYVAAVRTVQSGISQFAEMDFDDKDVVVILDGKNVLKFIPYAVATGDSDALLHSLYMGGSWENQNLIDTIVDSSVLRRAFFPLIKHSSMTGKELDINYDGSQDVIEMGQGEDAQTFVPPPIDSAMSQLAQMNSQKMGQAVGIRNLGMMDIAGNVQFSTVQAQIQLQLTALQPYKRTDEKALAHLALLMFKWIKFTGKSEIAYRTQKRVKKDGQVRGEQLLVTPDDFDPDVMLISCELLSNSPSDKQQLVNMYSTLKQAGAQVSWGELLERLQMGNPEMLKAGWLDEQIENAALQNYVAEQQQALQLKTQAATMQMQMQMQQAQQQQQMAAQQQAAQAQQQPQPQGGQGQPTPEEMAMMGGNPPQGDPVQAGGQERNPAAGGEPAMMSNPGLTRENVRNPG